MEPISIPRPSDFHAHFRWGNLFDAVAPEIMQFGKYVLAMPNNGPGEGGIIRTMADAHRVYHRIIDMREKLQINSFAFPIMTLYHTVDVTPHVVEAIGRSPIVRAVKDYPAHGGTTQSGHGIPFDEHEKTIRAMEENGVPLLIHAEDVLDKNGHLLPHAEREAHCVRERLRRFRDRHPKLRICVEHASTREAIDFVREDSSGTTAMTVTPQHLLFIANDFDRLSWRNHLRCMPYVKTPEDRAALLDFVRTGDRRCIAGSDTAPHPSAPKNKPFEEAACGCWLPHAIALYALASWSRGTLTGNHLENFVQFMSWNGPDWWGLPRPAEGDTITIREESVHDIPEPAKLSDGDVVIPLGWTVENDRLRVGFACS